MQTLYYLPAHEVAHCQFVIDNGYPYESIDLGTQRYVVFEFVERPGIGIAWPTVTGGMDGINKELDTVFQPDSRIQDQILAKLKNKDIRAILFPRYGR